MTSANFQAMAFTEQDQSLPGFVQLLLQLGVPHRLSEHEGRLILWVYFQEHIAVVNELYQRYLNNDIPQGLPVIKPVQTKVNIVQLLKQNSVVLVLILLSLAGFLMVQWQWIDGISLFSFQGLQIVNNELQANDASLALQNIRQGQWWRLVMPIFLHFDLMHIVFNMTILWFFGHQIERKEGGFSLLSYVLLIAVISNVAQFFNRPEGLFGGMSGVDYGLMGYAFLINLLCKKPVYQIPVGFVIVSVIMIGLGFLDVFALFGYAVANIVHLLGLMMGLLLAVLFHKKFHTKHLAQ